MSLLSSTDQDSFLNALRTAGLSAHGAKGLEADGKIHRYRVEGDKSGSLNGWYVLHVDSAFSAGAFGSWKTGESQQWCSKSELSLSPPLPPLVLLLKRVFFYWLKIPVMPLSRDRNYGGIM